MGESFYSNRFEKNVWLTNHAIETMVKRNIILPEIKTLLESGEYRENKDSHGWIYFEFPERDDNLVCAAVIDADAIIV